MSRVSAHLRCAGVTWELKGHAGALDDMNVDVELHRQFASHSPFLSPGQRTAFSADRVAILDAEGQVVEERANPRASFAGHVLETPWDRIQLGYFCGYAMWTYLTTPFVFAESDFRAEELGPWRENGETWRRLRVCYPARIATHTATQTFYFEEKGLIRRHDYTAELINGGPAAHYSYGHTEVDGIVVPSVGSTRSARTAPCSLSRCSSQSTLTTSGSSRAELVRVPPAAALAATSDLAL